MVKQIETTSLFDLTHTLAADLLASVTYPFEALPLIGEFIARIGRILPEEEYEAIGSDIWVARDAVLAPSAMLHGPCIIDHNAELRTGSFLRGNVLVGKNAVVGNSTELKNVILFDNVQVPHYNYVGDSILGYKAHMGAGAITSNVKSDKSLVVLKGSDFSLPTHLKKVGAMLGDFVEVGCNTVLNPGTVVGRNTQIYPLSSVRGVVPADCIYKSKTMPEIVKKI